MQLSPILLIQYDHGNTKTKSIFVILMPLTNRDPGTGLLCSSPNNNQQNRSKIELSEMNWPTVNVKP